jgi:predicted MPP superfamily phosphohydrolase
MELLGLLIWIGACVGHTAILAYSLNRWYGHALPHHLLYVIRQFHGLLVATGWCLFSWFCRLGWPMLSNLATPVRREFDAEFWWQLSGLYVCICLVAGYLAVPAVTLIRRMRPCPAFLESTTVRNTDLAAELGYCPFGRGRYRPLAHLPGNEIFRVDFTERTFLLPGLPHAWNGLTILHLSDLHMQGTPDRAFFQWAMDQCRDWEPDIVAITGDIVDGPKHHRWILPVLSRLRWREAGYAILGNHDTWFNPKLIRRRLGRLGLRVIGNGWEQIMVRGQPLVVIGNETPWIRPGPDLTSCPTDVFRLCLSHTPDNIRWAQQNRINLMLAGHNHGGQIRFPVIGSVLVPSQYGRRYDCGVFDEPPVALHVSRGLGGIQPLRYNCKPEVTKLTLKQAPRPSC